VDWIYLAQGITNVEDPAKGWNFLSS